MENLLKKMTEQELQDEAVRLELKSKEKMDKTASPDEHLVVKLELVEHELKTRFGKRRTGNDKKLYQREDIGEEQ